jgi:hypothetical protein
VNSDLDYVTSLTTDDLILDGEIYFQNAGDSSGGHDQRFIYWGDTGDVDTYIHEYTDDVLRVVCDNSLVMAFGTAGIEASVQIKVDTINEFTTDAGVTIESVSLEDGAITQDTVSAYPITQYNDTTMRFRTITYNMMEVLN